MENNEFKDRNDKYDSKDKNELNLKLYQVRLKELETENEKILGIGNDKIDKINEKISIISDIYSCFGSLKNKQQGLSSPKRRSSRNKKQKKLNLLKNSNLHINKSEVEILKEEKKRYIEEIKKYKEALWLQSRTISELTYQQNELLKSVGDYRKGCAARLERIAFLGNEEAKKYLGKPSIHKSTQTQNSGVCKAVQCFMADPVIEKEVSMLKKRQVKYSEKFEDIMKIVMANESVNTSKQRKRLKRPEDDSFYGRRLTYDDSNFEDKDRDFSIENEDGENLSIDSANIGKSDLVIERMDKG